MTIATCNDDNNNNVDGNGATGDKVNDDGDGGTGNDDDDNIDINVKQHSEPSIISNPSQKWFGPCGSKDCKPPQQWEVCSNSKNSFINCSNVIGEKCQKKYGGLCRICLIAGGTTIRR